MIYSDILSTCRDSCRISNSANQDIYTQFGVIRSDAEIQRTPSKARRGRPGCDVASVKASIKLARLDLLMTTPEGKGEIAD